MYDEMCCRAALAPDVYTYAGLFDGALKRRDFPLVARLRNDARWASVFHGCFVWFVGGGVCFCLCVLVWVC